MKEVSSELIVLHTTKFGESSVVVHTISDRYGRRSFLVRGAGKKSSMSLFLPMNIIEADIVESPRARLYTARNITAKYPLSGIRGNLYKNSITLFLSEVLYRVVREGGVEQDLFDWCEKSILLLDAMEADFSNFHIRFLLELAVVLGFSPDTERIRQFPGPHQDMIARFLRAPFGESMLIPLSGELRNSLAEEILGYIGYHSESSVNVRSLKVLHELLR